MAGRKPKPTAVKKLEGNPGKRKLNTKEPNPGKGMPDCPAWLLPEAKTEWIRLSEKLNQMGVLTENDRSAFAAYCQSYGGIREACCGGPEEGCSEGGQDRKAADRKHGSEEDGEVFQELGSEENQGNVGFHPDRGAFQTIPADTSFGVWPCEARRWKDKGVSSYRAGRAGGHRAADKGYRA